MAKKFRVIGTAMIDVEMVVEAENAEEAMEVACNEFYIENYVGNGGTGDKLIGTREPNISLDASDFDLEIDEEGTEEVEDDGEEE